jgi:hypothetical protein
VIAGAIARALELRIAEAVEVLLHGCTCGGAPRGRHDRDCERHQCDDKAEGDGSGSRRPGRVVGTSRGDLDGSPLTKSDLHDHHPPNSWAGARKDSLLPMLFLRATPGDTGTRPVVGPFWESPDIYILAGVSPDDAPDLPPALGETAQAGAENTVYAHVWNLGRAAADDVVVEFFWIDPSLGIDAGGMHSIGQTTTWLGSRDSGHSHRVVKCPEPWVATYANGGHECLVVRAWSVIDDQLGVPAWDAANNRHIGQRNIHVVSADQAAVMPPVQLHIGPLYGGPATIQVDRAAPGTMPWLQLHTGSRGLFPAPPTTSTGQPLLTAPAPIGAATAAASGSQHDVSGDGQQTSFHTTDPPPAAGQARVYRVTASQDGQVFGGYTIVVTG